MIMIVRSARQSKPWSNKKLYGAVNVNIISQCRIIGVNVVYTVVLRKNIEHAKFAIIAHGRKGEPMNKQRIVRPIIKNRLIYIYNPEPIKFFFWYKPEGLLITNFRFRVSYSRCNSKNLNKLHILVRTPLLCINRDNGGTTIGNKHQLFFVKHRAERRTDG